MQSNAFYKQEVPVPVRCEVPKIDPSNAPKADYESFLNTSIECLMRMWAPEVQAAGFKATRPPLVVYHGTQSTPCGDSPDEEAIYCSDDQKIYFADDFLKLFPQQQDDSYVLFAVMAHHFSHVVQGQTGILWSEWKWHEYYLGKNDPDSANKVNRRMELQADCLGGEFLQSVSQSAGISDSEMATIKAFFYSMADDTMWGGNVAEPDHGLGKNRQAWLTVGLTSSTVAACNTFDPKVTDSQIK